VDGYIKDEWGRTWWLINFPDDDRIRWEDFENTIVRKKVVELEDGTTFCKGLALNRKDERVKNNIKCLKILLAQISGVNKLNFEYVTCESFGKLLSWFGPGVEVDGDKISTFMDRIWAICSKAWFHGKIDNAEAILHEKIGSYLVRLSTQAGCFTIQTSQVAVRIIYTPGKGFKEELRQEGEWFNNMDTLLSEKLPQMVPCGNSEFSSIFGTAVEPSYGELGLPLEVIQGLSDKTNVVLSFISS